MKVNKTGREPKRQRSGKMPLTYYRSATNKRADSLQNNSPKRGLVRVLFNRSLGIVIVCFILFALTYSLIVDPNPTLKTSSQIYRPATTYQIAAEDAFKSISNRNKISLNEAEINKKLHNQFPEISNLQIDLPLLSHTPQVIITISPPGFIINSNNRLYVVDLDGRAVGAVSEFSGLPKKLPVVMDQSSFKISAGRPIMSSASVNFINDLIAICDRAKIPIKSLTLPTRAQEIDLTTQDQAYQVRFFLGGKVDRQAGQMMAARNHFIVNKIQPTQYLDVRVEGKIFYK